MTTISVPGTGTHSAKTHGGETPTALSEAVSMSAEAHDDTGVARRAPLPAGVASDRPRVRSIQILRGVAACFVVLYHTEIILGHRSYGTNAQFGALAQWGWLGVNLFFVISGFTIFLAHHRDIGFAHRIGRYTWRRFIRIYPIYWLLMGAFILATYWKPEYRALDIRPGNLATMTLLVPFVQDPELPLKVAWTMLFEVMFYAIFAVAMLDRRASRLLWPTWTVAILLSSFVWNRYALDPLNVYNLYFMLGGLTWWAMPYVDRRVIPVMVGLFVVGIVPAMFLATHRSNVDHDNVALAFLAVPVTLGLAITVAAEKFWPKLFSSRLLLLVGDASYSIYLVHSAFLSVAGALQSRMLVWVPGVVYFCVAMVGSVIAGIVIHLVVERPLLARLRDRIVVARARP